MAKDRPAEAVSAWAPASLSNLGPGFDSLGVAITGLGDRVTVRRTRAQTSVTVEGEGSRLPTDPRLNTASVAAMKVIELSGHDVGVEVSIQKGIPFGSGLGGSAASAAAGAVATNAVLGDPIDRAGLVAATLAGESVASGSLHGDNAIPALVGGVVLVDAVEPTRYRKLDGKVPLRFAIVVPEIHVETSLARRMLATEVPLQGAVRNASSLAWLVEAIREGDLDVLGEMVMRDTLVEPVRAALIPCYDIIKNAALAAGAPGCGLSGSGPAIFALCRSPKESVRILGAMTKACEEAGFGCLSLEAEVDQRGTFLD